MDRAIEQFIRDTQHGPIILIGHSLGGWLAARYAVAHPRSVRHLILINNAGIKYDGFEQQAELFRFRDVDDVRRLLQKMWYRYPWYFKPFASSIYKSLKQKQIDQFVHSINDEDLLNRSFKSLHLPIDILWGANDGLISNTSVEIMKQLAPQAKEHFIPECGHVPQLERPRELIHVLTAVLTSL
jgi:pimeloyl-ACP methyl ester carboxylesterase